MSTCDLATEPNVSYSSKYRIPENANIVISFISNVCISKNHAFCDVVLKPIFTQNSIVPCVKPNLPAAGYLRVAELFMSTPEMKRLDSNKIDELMPVSPALQT